MINLAAITSKYRGKLIIDAYRKWIKRGETVLDVGCGNGVVSNEIKNQFKLNLTGCDVMSYLTENIPFIKMKSEDKLPFRTKSFDIAMFNDVLHHTSFATQQKLLVEALRVADKVLIFEVKPTIVGIIADYLLNKVHNKNMNIPFTFRTVGGWQALFKSLGIKYGSLEVKRPLFYPFSHIVFYLQKKGL